MRGVLAAAIRNRAMQRLVYLFLMFAVAGVVAANQLDRSAKPSGNGANAMAMATKPASAPPTSTSSDYRSVTLLSDRRGHFQTNLMVDGRTMDLLVDTGASSVALRESDAARLGYHPSARDYTVLMQTANGIGKAARVRLDRVELK